MMLTAVACLGRADMIAPLSNFCVPPLLSADGSESFRECLCGGYVFYLEKAIKAL